MSAAENSTKAAVPGRPFVPGQSGNPGGRKPGVVRKVRELVGEDGEKAIELMFAVMEDENAPRRDRMVAASWLIDRGFGKAVNFVAIDETGSSARHPLLDLSKLSTDRLRLYRELIEEARPDSLPVIDQ